jgi:hypothetical protein
VARKREKAINAQVQNKRRSKTGRSSINHIGDAMSEAPIYRVATYSAPDQTSLK